MSTISSTHWRNEQNTIARVSFFVPWTFSSSSAWEKCASSCSGQRWLSVSYLRARAFSASLGACLRLSSHPACGQSHSARPQRPQRRAGTQCCSGSSWRQPASCPSCPRRSSGPQSPKRWCETCRARTRAGGSARHSRGVPTRLPIARAIFSIWPSEPTAHLTCECRSRMISMRLAVRRNGRRRLASRSRSVRMFRSTSF